MLKNAWYALYLQRGPMDFNQTCTDILTGDEKRCLDFGNLDSIFKDTGQVENSLVCTLFL